MVEELQRAEPALPRDTDTEVAKLVSERNSLLHTGVYLSHDHIIRQIDARIKVLLASRT